MAGVVQKNKQIKSKKQVFRWDASQIKKLLDSLLAFKAKMAFKGLDFDADKPRMYSEIRKEMAGLYAKENQDHFGPVELTTLERTDSENLSEEEIYSRREAIKKEKEMISRGKNRIQEKIKEIRQNYSKAVKLGTRSGSGQIVFEHYEKLVGIWGGSASTEALPFGVQSDDFNHNEMEGGRTFSRQNSNDDIQVTDDNIIVDEHESSNFSSGSIDMESNIVVERDNILTNNDNSANSSMQNSERKRKSVVPQLIDNKRRHLEKNLSSAQRDKLLLAESREDSEIRKDLAAAMRDSTASFTSAMENIGRSMNSMCQSIEMLSRALCNNINNNNTQQNLLYQNVPQQNNMQNVLHQNNFQNILEQRHGYIPGVPYAQWLNDIQNQESE